jgi:hypothetical protein
MRKTSATAPNPTTTQPSKSKSNAQHPLLKPSDYFKLLIAALYRFWPGFAIDT